MLLLLTLTIILLNILTSLQDTPPSLIIDLFRHGSRGPNDNRWDPTWDSSDCNELTAVGMRQHYILGKVIREEYTNRYGPNFLLSNLSMDKIYVRSTDVDRTIMSAYSHLYGIFEDDGFSYTSKLDTSASYPPFADSALVQEIAAELKNTSPLPLKLAPFPVEMLPGGTDIVLQGEDCCRNFGNWRNINVGSFEYSLMISRLQNTLDTLAGMGYPLNDWWTLNDFADTILVDQRENRTLPSNLTWDSELIQNITFLYNWGSVFTQFGQPIQMQTMSTTILNYILDLARASINGTSKLQLVLLSAHDDSLMQFLTPLGVVTSDCIYINFLHQRQNKTIPFPNCQYPTFAADVRVEVFNISKPYLRIYYDGAELFLCGKVGTYCSLEDFEDLVNTTTNGTTVEDYTRLCGNSEIIPLDDFESSEESLDGLRDAAVDAKGEDGFLEWVDMNRTCILLAVVVILAGLLVWQVLTLRKVEPKKRVRQQLIDKSAYVLKK